MKNLAKTKVGAIVTENFNTSTVLAAYDIDFCCGGGISLEEACKRKNANLQKVIEELEELFESKTSIAYQDLGLDELIDLIVSSHHKYITSTSPAIQIFLEKLCKVHGYNHPELHEIKDLFNDGVDALSAHMKKEELVLFPYIKAMVQSSSKGFPLSRPHFEHIDNPIHMMEDEHENEGIRFKKIAELSDNYKVPEDGCRTYSVAYSLLNEFEEDLHKHIHLENNILFPAAQRLFKELNF